MEEMEAGEVEYESAEEFLTCLRKEFGGGRRGVSESGRAEEAGARRKNDGGVHTGVQVGSKRKWI